MKKLVHTDNMRFKRFKGCKKKDIIQIDYKRIKIVNHSLYCKQNYNLLKKCFNSLIINFTTNKN